MVLYKRDLVALYICVTRKYIQSNNAHWIELWFKELAVNTFDIESILRLYFLGYFSKFPIEIEIHNEPCINVDSYKGLWLSKAIIHLTGKIVTLKNFKVEVESVKSGQECGISLDDPNIKFEPQDRIVSYEVTDKEDQVHWTLGFWPQFILEY